MSLPEPARGRIVYPEVELPEKLARLIDLQLIDRELRQFNELLSSITERVELLRDETDKAQAALEALTREQSEAEAVRKRMERELAEGEARIRNKRMRLNLVRNDKELQALGLEVDALKENNQRLEAEILIQMEAAEQRSRQIAEWRGTIEEKTAALGAAEQDVAGRAGELRDTIAKRRTEREKLAAAIDGDLLRRYEMIFERRGGMAVAEAKAGTCQGCRRRIPPQLYNQVQKRGEIHFCPNCQRILYFEG
jgi:uncharacterized protein